MANIEISPNQQEGGIPPPDSVRVDITPETSSFTGRVVDPVFDISGLIEPQTVILTGTVVNPEVVTDEESEDEVDLPDEQQLINYYDVLSNVEEIGAADSELPDTDNLVNDYDIL